MAPEVTFYGAYSSAKGNTRIDTQEDIPLNIIAAGGYPHRMALLKVGDVVDVLCPAGYGHHSAQVLITKVNKKTFNGVEIKGSYKAGRNWSIHKEASSIHLNYYHMPHVRMKELARQGWNKQSWEV